MTEKDKAIEALYDLLDSTEDKRIIELLMRVKKYVEKT